MNINDAMDQMRLNGYITSTLSNSTILAACNVDGIDGGGSDGGDTPTPTPTPSGYDRNKWPLASKIPFMVNNVRPAETISELVAMTDSELNQLKTTIITNAKNLIDLEFAAYDGDSSYNPSPGVIEGAIKDALSHPLDIIYDLPWKTEDLFDYSVKLYNFINDIYSPCVEYFVTAAVTRGMIDFSAPDAPAPSEEEFISGMVEDALQHTCYIEVSSAENSWYLNEVELMDAVNAKVTGLIIYNGTISNINFSNDSKFNSDSTQISEMIENGWWPQCVSNYVDSIYDWDAPDASQEAYEALVGSTVTSQLATFRTKYPNYPWDDTFYMWTPMMA